MIDDIGAGGVLTASKEAGGQGSGASTAADATRVGLTDHCDVVDASLAAAAAPDRVTAWWAETHATLPDDFEAAV